MAKKPKPAKAEALTITINGHTLTGQKLNGLWQFACPSWPELAESHSGSADASYAVVEFTTKALAGCVTVSEAKE